MCAVMHYYIAIISYYNLLYFIYDDTFIAWILKFRFSQNSKGHPYRKEEIYNNIIIKHVTSSCIHVAKIGNSCYSINTSIHAIILWIWNSWSILESACRLANNPNSMYQLYHIYRIHRWWTICIEIPQSPRSSNQKNLQYTLILIQLTINSL